MDNTSSKQHISPQPLPLEVKFRCENSDEFQEKARELAELCGLSFAAAQILLSRKIDSEQRIKSFLAPSFREELPNPETMLNLDAAVQLTLDVLEQKKNILVYADFDVDGLSSGSQMLLYLKALGAKVDIYVPNRFTEGYGLVMPAVEEILQRDVHLLITVDCGISSSQEIARLRAEGIQTIVIDHHIPPGNPQQLPLADVVVDPAQDGCPFQSERLAAAGLVWMFLVLLRKRAEERYPEKKEFLPNPKDFLDLAALGTICDMVPLMGVNRLLAYRGLEALERSSRPGILALKRVAGVQDQKRFSTGHVGFGLGPRINAAGRLADGRDVVTLLTTTDSLRAKSLAELLDRLNEKRKSIEDQVREVCIARVQENPSLLEQSAFVLFGEDFHPGVIGIVAQRMVERFHRPAIVLAPGEMNVKGRVLPVLKGSIRSVPGFHIADALLALKDHIVSGGGHAEAGGCTILPEKLADFEAAFLDLAARLLPRDSLARRATVDLRLSLRELDLKLANELQRFQPFGVGNPSPVFLSSGVKIETVSSIGNNHLKLRVSEGNSFLNAVAWGFQGHPLLRKNEILNIVYQVEINTYQGVSTVQLSLKEAFL